MAIEGLEEDSETGGGGRFQSSGSARLERSEEANSDVRVITLLRLLSIGLGYISGGGGRKERASGG